MNKALSELIRISNSVGCDSTLVQGGGGNTSVKTADGKYMYIKASGTTLKDMNAKKGWRRLRLDKVLLIVEDESLAKLEASVREPEVVDRLLLACDDKVAVEARPSVEAHLHAFLDKCVIHLHPSSVGAYANAVNGKAEIEKLFKTENLPPLWVPYTDPGFVLAKKISGLVNKYQKKYGKKPPIMILEKHGLLIAANNADDALQLVRKVIRCCSRKLKQPKAKKEKSTDRKVINEIKKSIRKAFTEAVGECPRISYFCNNDIAAFWQQRGAKEMLACGVLTPDELVYANGAAMWVDKVDGGNIAKRLIRQIKKGDKHSIAFLVKNVGLFVAGGDKIARTVRDIVVYSIFIRINAARMGGIHCLTKREQDFINKWEAEAFRKKQAN